MTTDLYAELHARPFVSIQTPKLVSVFTLADEHIGELIGDIIPQDFDINTRKQIKYDYRTLDNCGNVILVTEVVLQKHTSFICFYFIVDSNKTCSMWNAIPHDIYNKNKNIIENRAIFKTHLIVEKFDPNNRAMNYGIEETFNRDFKNIDVDEEDKFLKNEYDIRSYAVAL